MARRRAIAAGIGAEIGNQSFLATGVTAHLKNGGVLERAATLANHASTRTTQLYYRRSDDITLDEVERMRNLRLVRAQRHSVESVDERRCPREGARPTHGRLDDNLPITQIRVTLHLATLAESSSNDL